MECSLRLRAFDPWPNDPAHAISKRIRGDHIVEVNFEPVQLLANESSQDFSLFAAMAYAGFTSTLDRNIFTNYQTCILACMIRLWDRVGNDHLCDTTERASQLLTPMSRGRFPCITELVFFSFFKAARTWTVQSHPEPCPSRRARRRGSPRCRRSRAPATRQRGHRSDQSTGWEFGATPQKPILHDPGKPPQ